MVALPKPGTHKQILIIHRRKRRKRQSRAPMKNKCINTQQQCRIVIASLPHVDGKKTKAWLATLQLGSLDACMLHSAITMWISVPPLLLLRSCSLIRGCDVLQVEHSAIHVLENFLNALFVIHPLREVLVFPLHTAFGEVQK